MLPELVHPWQERPTELFNHSINLLISAKNDFEKQEAFKAFDSSIETLLKAYLDLDPGISGAKTSFAQRQDAIRGNFHQLIEGTKNAAGNIINDINLDHVKFYHELRNTLYHEGKGLTIPEKTLIEYAKISVKLLDKLLAVNLTTRLDEYFSDISRWEYEMKVIKSVRERQFAIEKALKDLEKERLSKGYEFFPEMATQAFEERFNGITNKYLVKYITGSYSNDGFVQRMKMTDDPALIANYRLELMDLLIPVVNGSVYVKRCNTKINIHPEPFETTVNSSTIFAPYVRPNPTIQYLLEEVLKLYVHSAASWWPNINYYLHDFSERYPTILNEVDGPEQFERDTTFMLEEINGIRNQIKYFLSDDFEF